MEMLENSIRKYHNKIITAAQVIEELISLGKEIQQQDKEPHEMGLTDFEYAFYTAIANNESARQVMEKDKTERARRSTVRKVRENASIDWTVKESVKAKLKVIVKRTLRSYGYPPDMQKLATETVLKQAELIAEELATV
jgi:type I restriction enzyme, R subunit